MAKRRWSSRALTDCTDFKGSIMPHYNLAGRMVRLGECEVMILGAYFKCGEGLAGTNLVLLRNIEFLTRTGKQCFILGADFNIEPKVWYEDDGSWLKRMNATIVTPRNTGFTCRGGKSGGGSMIDYFIVSMKVASVVKDCVAEFSVPWALTTEFVW